MLAVALPSLLTAAVFIVVTVVGAFVGLHTFRIKYGAYYKDAYEEQRTRAEGFETKYEAERDLKQHLVAELAAERAKRDLSSVVDTLAALMQNQTKQMEILERILNRLERALAA
jgi:uncharacterized sporulation protein YeaH/YhbH (DUF444 family)